MSGSLAPLPPLVNAAIQEALAPFSSRFNNIEALLERVCSAGQVQRSMVQQGSTVPPPPQQPQPLPGYPNFPKPLPPGGHGGCGGSCGGGCGGSCGGPNGACPNPNAIPVTPGAPPLMVLPQCYQDCDCIDPCLYEFLRDARSRFDEWAWLELMKNEGEIVHLDVNVGGAGYQVPAVPLAANQNSIQVQNGAQQLPWQPGLIKIDAEWTGNPAPGLVVVNFYSGPIGLTGITDPVAAGLIKIGPSYKLADFACADDCYLLRWPKLWGCKTSAIPDTRRIYVEVRVGAVGAATISSLNVTILKRGTEQCGSWRDKCGWKSY